MRVQSTTTPPGGFTPHASLAALGAKLHALDLFDPVRQRKRPFVRRSPETGPAVRKCRHSAAHNSSRNQCLETLSS